MLPIDSPLLALRCHVVFITFWLLLYFSRPLFGFGAVLCRLLSEFQKKGLLESKQRNVDVFVANSNEEMTNTYILIQVAFYFYRNCFTWYELIIRYLTDNLFVLEMVPNHLNLLYFNKISDSIYSLFISEYSWVVYCLRYCLHPSWTNVYERSCDIRPFFRLCNQGEKTHQPD